MAFLIFGLAKDNPHTKMNQLYTLLLSIALFLSSKGTAQSIVAEATSVKTSEFYDLGYFTSPLTYSAYQGQTFQASSTNTLATIQFYIYDLQASGSVNIEIYSCSTATLWGSLLGTQSNVSINTTGWITADVSSLNIGVASGNYYGFRLVPSPSLQAGTGVTASDYPGGSVWATNSFGYSSFESNDLSFKVTGSAVLPVKLVSFTAQKENNKVLLQWSTATESNSKNFVVQYSVDQKDWSDIGTVAAAGNSNSIINYQYLYTNPPNGVNYYRLLQTDLDGKSSFSETRTVKFANDNKVFTVLSNPVQSNQLRIQLNENRTVSLFTTDGNLVWKKQLQPGLQTIDVSSCSKGLYLLQAGTLIERIVIK